MPSWSPSFYLTLGLVNFVLKLFFPGAAGILGLYLSSKIGFKDILNDEIKQKKNILLVIFVGIIMATYFIGYETLFYKVFNRSILKYYYSTLPAAIFASVAEGIGDQILLMFYLSFLVWFFSKIRKSVNGSSTLFWVAATIYAVFFSYNHITSTMVYEVSWKYGHILGLYFHEFIIVLGLYGPLALVCAYFLKRFGLLSAIIIHFITDISWRVMWAYVKMGDLVFV
jgi:hypothetical protein